jgi:hypothetical protein
MEKKEREKIRDLALMRRTVLRSTRRSHAASVVQLFATPVIMLGWKKFSPKPLAYGLRLDGATTQGTWA